MTQTPISPLTRRSLIQASAMAAAGTAVGGPPAAADGPAANRSDGLRKDRTALVLIEFQGE